MSVWRASTLLLAALGLGCGSAVVGGDCADGYERCGASCVPSGGCSPSSDTDPRADSGIAPISDAVVPEDTLAFGDGRNDTAIGAPADADGGDSCPPPPYDTVSNCGACGVVCSGALGVCKLGSFGVYGCASPCSSLETWCGACVDTDLDPMNCGGCGIVCTSGLCNGGKCRGAKSGHVAVLGHDYSTSPTAAATQVVSNAVFLPSRSPVRVLAYDGWADPVAVANVTAILDGTTKKTGRTYTRKTASTTTSVIDKLNVDDFDVLLVYDQSKASSGTLALDGAALQKTLTSFTQTGGTVVVLDGAGGTGEMPKLLTASGLLNVTAHTSVTGLAALVVAPTDALGNDVITPYYAIARSTTFVTTDAPSPTAIVVVEEEKSSQPIVIHRIVKKP